MTVEPRFHSLQEWLNWQESLHPKKIDLGLARVGEVWHRLSGRKPAHFVITVAGTNGKGSSVTLLESVYRRAGYKVGSFISPHMLRYNERIKIQGIAASDAVLCTAFAAIDTARQEIGLTYFEFSTLAALLLFEQANLDVAILEVGLGGRLDATNIIDADVALITSIGLDHQNWLGETREQIALEKAGILRSGKPAVCGDPSPPDTLLNYACTLDVRLLLAGQAFAYEIQPAGWRWHSKAHAVERENLSFPSLAGAQQLQNASAVLAVVHELLPVLPVSPVAFNAAISNWFISGRFQQIGTAPQLIVDVAHNEEAIQCLCRTLSQHQRTGRLHLVFGMLNDKALEAVVSCLSGVVDCWYLTALASERAFSVDELLTAVLRHAPQQTITVHASVTEAWQHALRQAAPADTVLATGSFFVVSEVLGRYGKVGL